MRGLSSPAHGCRIIIIVVDHKSLHVRLSKAFMRDLLSPQGSFKPLKPWENLGVAHE